MSAPISPHQEDEKELHDSSSPASISGPPPFTKANESHKSRGVLRMEAIARAGKSKVGRQSLYLTGFLIMVMTFVDTMQSSTTYNYSVWATSSFQQHSGGIAMLSIATSIISAITYPFIAKLSDVFSRPWMYFVSLNCYVWGFVMILKSPNLATYTVGSVSVAIGSTSLTMITTILTADLINLQWRAFAQGALSSFYIVTPFFTGQIANALSTNNNWRWGYGMYAIIIPFVMLPAITVLLWLDHRASKIEQVSQGELETEKHVEVHVPASAPKAPWTQRFLHVLSELDAFGLLLLGFGWSLLLLPFSLSSYADGDYSNRSLIAMFVVGGVCLLAYAFYEIRYARFPSSPKRLLVNKTFVTACIINFFYMLSSYMNLLYLSSYTYIVKDWSIDEWTYYSNTLSISLCLFGVIAGLIMRYTHRYKLLQIIGIIIKMIGYGLMVDKNGVRDTARLVISQILAGIGSAFSTMGNQVSSQACVPHQDVAVAIATLLLWSSIGASIGSAISSAVWSNTMPGNLAKFMPPSINATELEGFFNDITSIRVYDIDSDVRQGAILAYEATVYPLWAGALGVSSICLIAALFQSNYYLGTAQNNFDGAATTGELTNEHTMKEQVPKTKMQKILSFWDL
ncbi:major facilitator superfamily domain-containing protein [Mrakia frigida]|uniref:major facilitator superfamily domain-containing protein n=1 Tax=Mrakia frigida TaxID=29902 RepID=UPI003FCBF816